MVLKQLIIRIGGNPQDYLKKIYDNPKSAKPNTHTLFLKKSNELTEILSPKRLELLTHLIKHQTERKTISEIAQELKRKQEAISRDANTLAKYKMLEKVKEEQRVYLQPTYSSLQIELAQA
jgi:predicted transcriptional regulator